MMPEWGSNQEGLKDRAEIWDWPAPFPLPQPYRGFFEINGPLTGSLRYHMTSNKLSMGGIKEQLLTDTFWGRSGGRIPNDPDIGIQGKIQREKVYGFYILWGLRITGIFVMHAPFGPAKLFPVQPRVEMKNIRAQMEMEVIKAGYDIKVISNP